MNKFVFTYLVKQDEKTWFDLTNSLYLLNKLILSKLKCSYKVLIFCEGPPSEKAGKLINFLLKKNINIKLKEISLKKYVKRDSLILLKIFSITLLQKLEYFQINITKN